VPVPIVPLINVRAVRVTRKRWWCCVCERTEEAGGPCVSTFGYAETGDPPYRLRAHPRCFVDPDGDLVPRLIHALQVIAARRAAQEAR